MGRASQKKKAPAKEVQESNLPAVLPSYTSAPGMLPSPTRDFWATPEATTNAQADIDQREFAHSSAELIDKVLHRGIPLKRRTAYVAVVLGWVAFVGWSFSQDNGAGKLDSFAGIEWFLAKTAVITLLLAFAALLIRLMSED